MGYLRVLQGPLCLMRAEALQSLNAYTRCSVCAQIRYMPQPVAVLDTNYVRNDRVHAACSLCVDAFQLFAFHPGVKTKSAFPLIRGHIVFDLSPWG